MEARLADLFGPSFTKDYGRTMVRGKVVKTMERANTTRSKARQKCPS